MTEDVQDRRDPKAQRKPVTTLVEVCGNVPGVPVFEAESLDVSARGMHLRTAYLPESGTPLVCRFESEGREIVVEGTVAWRREAGRGGEFGVRFTALDSRSVDALRGLCSPDSGGSDDHKANLGGEPGARVRLHIDGLGSPMKARVKTGGRAKVQVGSSLEFLKVGRRLELEDLDLGGRRPAEIDGVSVMVDPSTQIPQLVVALRFEGSDEDTPSPSVAPVMKSDRNAEERGLRIPASSVTTDAVASKARETAASEAKSPEPKSTPPRASDTKASDTKAAESKSTETEDDDDDAPEMRGAVAVLASNAEKKVKDASQQLARATSQASQGAKSLFLGAAEKIRALRAKSSTPARRTTSPAPGMNSVAEKPKLRPQSGAKASEEAEENARVSRKAIGVVAGASVLAIAGLALALKGGSAPPVAAKAGAETAAVNIGERAAGEASPTGATLNSNPNGAVTANVPLFGPTSLATTEPAPLGPPPGSEGAAIEEAEKAAARASLTSARDAFDDEGGDDGPGKNRSDAEDKSSKSSKRPEDVSPWGHGKMKDPVIHRLRLDAPGGELQGSVDPTGFTVVLPSRKVMEATTGITKRDDRIARIKATNNDSGAQISFRFKDGVPAYRVRLRRDFVEFLISEPSPEKATKASKNSDNKPRKRG